MVSPHHGHWRPLLAAMLFIASLTSGKLMAQDDPANDTNPVEEPTIQTTDSNQPVGSADRRKENVVSILLMLLAGVGVMGVALIGMTMMWGAHARRVARTTDHPPTQQDELWYLRRPPPADPVSDASSNDTDDTSPPERETES